MFRPIWPPSGVRIYLMWKLLLSVVAAVTCIGPLDCAEFFAAAVKNSAERSRML
jgi:hypothetical protein